MPCSIPAGGDPAAHLLHQGAHRRPQHQVQEPPAASKDIRHCETLKAALGIRTGRLGMKPFIFQEYEELTSKLHLFQEKEQVLLETLHEPLPPPRIPLVPQVNQPIGAGGVNGCELNMFQGSCLCHEDGCNACNN